MNITSQFLFKLIFELPKKDASTFLKKLDGTGLKDCAELLEKIISAYDAKSDKNISKFEKDLKLKLSPKLSKHYRVKKSKLKKELLIFLKEKNLESNLIFQIRDKIDTGVTLIELQHWDEGLSMIKEAKEEAIREEYFEEVLYALEKIRSYNFKIRRNSSSAYAFNNEVEHYLNLLQNNNQFIALSLYIFSFQGDFSANKEIISKIKHNELLQDEQNALSLLAKKFFYLSWLDIYNVEKDYEKMYDIVLKAVSYAEHATSINKFYARTLLLMYERLEFVANNLANYNESLRAIELIENFDIPKIYEKNSFFNRVITIATKTMRISNYANTNNPLLHPYCKEVEVFLEGTKMTLFDKSKIYYSLIFNYTVKLKAHKDSCNLGKKYIKHVLDHIDQINPNDNQTIQIFLCYFISAYENYTKETFEYLFEYLFNKKNAKYFVGKDAPYSYVYKLYNVLLQAFTYGFYSKEVLSTYYDIWKDLPGFLLKANCIPKSVLDKSYNQNIVESVGSKYSTVNFEC